MSKHLFISWFCILIINCTINGQNTTSEILITYIFITFNKNFEFSKTISRFLKSAYLNVFHVYIMHFPEDHFNLKQIDDSTEFLLFYYYYYITRGFACVLLNHIFWAIFCRSVWYLIKFDVSTFISDFF